MDSPPSSDYVELNKVDVQQTGMEKNDPQPTMETHKGRHNPEKNSQITQSNDEQRSHSSHPTSDVKENQSNSHQSLFQTVRPNYNETTTTTGLNHKLKTRALKQLDQTKPDRTSLAIGM